MTTLNLGLTAPDARRMMTTAGGAALAALLVAFGFGRAQNQGARVVQLREADRELNLLQRREPVHSSEPEAQDLCTAPLIPAIHALEREVGTSASVERVSLSGLSIVAAPMQGGADATVASVRFQLQGPEAGVSAVLTRLARSSFFLDTLDLRREGPSTVTANLAGDLVCSP